MSYLFDEYSESLNLEFYGILKDLDLSLINRGTIDLLLEKKIITVYSDNYQTANSKKMGVFIYFDMLIYKISDAVFNEIYSIVDLIIRQGEEDSIECDIDDIKFSLKRYLSTKDKITFLTDKYAEIFPADVSYGIYIQDDIYAKKILDSQGLSYSKYNTWKGVFFNAVIGSDIWLWYLTENIENLNDNENPFWYKIMLNISHLKPELSALLNKWEDFYIRKSVLGFVTEQINILKDKTDNTSDQSGLKSIMEPSIYNNFIKSLKDHDLITENLEIVIQPWKGFTELKMVSCIGWALNKNPKGRHNLKITQKELTDKLNKTFSLKDKLSEASYSNSKKNFNINLQNTHKDYLDELHFLLHKSTK